MDFVVQTTRSEGVRDNSHWTAPLPCPSLDTSAREGLARSSSSGRLHHETVEQVHDRDLGLWNGRGTRLCISGGEPVDFTGVIHSKRWPSLPHGCSGRDAAERLVDDPGISCVTGGGLGWKTGNRLPESRQSFNRAQLLGNRP